MPIFSIIMPAYNCEKFIADAIRSVINQDFKDFELIVIDDGSSDGTLKVATQLSERDPRVRVVSLPNSGKPSVVRNVGISLATGELLAFLDADDLYLPGRLRQIYEICKKHDEADVVLSDFVWIDGAGNRVGKRSFFEENQFEVRAKDVVLTAGSSCYRGTERFYGFASTGFAPMNTNSITIRRSHYSDELLKFDENLTLMEDFDLWFRVLAGRNAMICSHSLSAYRKYGNSISSKTTEFRRDQIKVHTRNFERGEKFFSKQELLAYRVRLADMYGDQGYLYAKTGRRLESIRCYARALRYSRRKWVIVAIFKLFIPPSMERFIKFLLR
ncbi:MAG: glycosyltransferase family 2 protein [Zoogloeaceae bacterium]|nr:glycosyltransferase family 2 protein [Zoogloeaceae bacterium]